MHKIGQSGGFLRRLLGPLLKTRFYLVGNVFKRLGKSVLVPLELTVAASATDAAIHKKMFGSSFTALIISNEEMKYPKIVKSFDESGLLVEGVSETIKKWRKRTKMRISSNIIRHFKCYFVGKSFGR